MKKVTDNWETDLKEIMLEYGYEDAVKPIKKFISQLLQKQWELMEKNISFLRQWLNEDRITDPKKMISNKDIKDWLELNQPNITDKKK